MINLAAEFGGMTGTLTVLAVGVLLFFSVFRAWNKSNFSRKAVTVLVNREG